MNIVMIIEQYFPILGGLQIQLKQLCDNLNEHGVSISIITRRCDKKFKRKEYIDGILVRRVGITDQGKVGKIWFLTELIFFLILSGKKNNIIHVHGDVPLGAVGSLCATLTGAYSVVKIYGAGLVKSISRPWTSKGLLYFLKMTDTIICLSEEINVELIEAGISTKKIIHIPNGVDTERFRPVFKSEKIKLKKEMGYSDNCPFVLFLGRLVAFKGLDVLLDAWPYVNSSVPNARLMIVGDSKYQNNRLEDSIKDKVYNKAVRNISFKGQTYTPENYYKIADVCVFPSDNKKEGCPNTVLEAMASGLGIVATDIGGVKTLIINGKTGITVPCQNPYALSIGIIELLSNTNYRDALGISARNHVVKRHSFSDIAKRYIDLYSSLITNR